MLVTLLRWSTVGRRRNRNAKSVLFVSFRCDPKVRQTTLFSLLRPIQAAQVSFQRIGPFFRFIALRLRHALIGGDCPMLGNQLALMPGAFSSS
jgi:hypothetical protein